MEALSIRRQVVSPASIESTHILAEASTDIPSAVVVGRADFSVASAFGPEQVGGNNHEAAEQRQQQQVEGDEIEDKRLAKKKVQREVCDVQSSLASQKVCLRNQTTLDRGKLSDSSIDNHQLDNSQTKEESFPAKLHNDQTKLAFRIKNPESTECRELKATSRKGEQKEQVDTTNSAFKFVVIGGGGEQRRATGVKKKSNSLLNSLIEGHKSWFEERTIFVDIRNSESKNINIKRGSQQTKDFNDNSDLIKNKVSCEKKHKIIKHLEQDEVQFDSLDQIYLTASNNLNNLKDKKRIYSSTKLASKSSNQIINKTFSANNSNSGSGYNSNKQTNNSNKNSISEQSSGKLISVEEEKSDKTNGEGKKLSDQNKEDQQSVNILDNKQQQDIEAVSKSNGKKAEDRQQLGTGKVIQQASKGKTPPTFGGTPSKVSRLPYYSYYGRARNVDLITAADREERLNRGKSHSRQSISGGRQYIDKSESDSSNSFDSSSGDQGAERSSSQHSNKSGGSSSASAGDSGGGVGKVPTLSRTSGYRDSRQIDDLNENHYQTKKSSTGQINENEAVKQQNINNSRSSGSGRKRRVFKNGYSNISNLFPEQHMNNYYSDKVEADNRQRERIRQLRFNSEELLASNRRARQQEQHWNSLLNLNQASRVKSSGLSSSRLAPSSSSLSRQNSISNYQQRANNRYTRPNRSMNSLTTSPYSNISDNQLQQQQQLTMRRQNSGSVYGSGAKQRGASYQSRSMSATSAYTRGHHRSPSASSLHYGSTGMSPYGAPPIDPDCPVHGYSPVNQVHSKSSQNLASGGGSDADLLYEPYNVGYYDRGAPPPVAAGGSLYSPTSPPLIDRPQAAAGGYGAKGTVGAGGRLLTAAANGNPNAYYNNTSRFSMYHSPINGLDNVRSTLAPPNEQLRRILGYQPHTRPIYLHPQWAYSRPFIHLQGTRSPSPGTPLDGDDDIIGGGGGGDIRPRFEQYNQLHDTQAIRAVDFHPSGEVYAVGSNSRALRICAYPADYELRHFSHDHVTTAPRILFKFLQVHRGSIYCVSFNSTGQLLATGSNDQTVHIVRYNSITHSPDGDEYRLTMHDGTVRDLCFIDDSTGNGSSLLLSAGGGDNKIYVTDCDTITPFQSMAGHTQMIMALHHWGGSNFVSASYDRTIRFWDLRTRACTSIISAPPSVGAGNGSGKWGGPGAPVCAVKVDPTGRLLASGHNDSTCMLYDIRGARIIQAFKPHDDEIRTVSFSPKSYYLLTGGYDGRIVLTDIQGDLTQPLPSVCVAESDDKIVQSKWHPSDFTFVTTSADKTATLWAMPTE